MNNQNKPAFPLSGEKHQKAIGNGYSPEDIQGLTKREHFAAMAMQGILANPYWAHERREQQGVNELYIPVDSKTIVHRSIELADELLKQLEQK